MQKHTYGTGLIGNCAYIAHIEKNTNISWLCLPRFDSDFIFGGMLDREKGGEFTVFPESEEFESYQEYLETTFLTYAFWYIEALACVGRLDEAVEGFETLINYCNHLQLFSEDVDQKTGSQ